MLSIVYSAALFLAVKSDGDDGKFAADISIASVGTVAGVVGAVAAVAALGRRRITDPLGDEERAFARLMLDEANLGICSATNNMFKAELMPEFVMSLVRKGDNKDKLEGLAEEVTEWCSEQSQHGRRRLGEDQSLVAQFTEFGRALKSEGAIRRLGAKTEARVPAHMYEQCKGYAAVMTQLIKAGEEDGAILFGASSNGSGKEKIHGCESVVKNVNRAVIDGELPGVSVVEDKDGVAIVVAEPSLADQLGNLAMAVTLASGTIVYKLMNLCEYYN